MEWRDGLDPGLRERWAGSLSPGAAWGAGQQPTCLPQDPLPKLKDLAFLKDQLESLQRRVEDEVHAGVGQVTHFLRRCGDPCVSGRTSHPS